MKIKILVLGTGNATARFIVENMNSRYIQIVGVIPDESVCEQDRELFINEINCQIDKPINVYKMSENYIQKADIVFSPEYRKIIPAELCNKYVFINCHAGILPKWRGFSANAWAIMNGEHEIGYSIHRVRPGVDDGEVYFIKRIPIEENQTYGDVHNIMINSIVSEVPKILFEFMNDSITPIQQPSCGFAYCNKFTKAMGNISGFENDSKYYVNLYRCMAKPLGTGLWFNYKGEKYTVEKIEHGGVYGVIDYIGVSGKIVNILNNQLWVKTKDNIVVLSGIRRNEEEIMVKGLFRNGNQII